MKEQHKKIKKITNNYILIFRRKKRICKMVQQLVLDIRKLFNMVQDGVVPSKICDMMESIKENNSDKDFYSGFINHLQKAMIFYKAEKAVERVMDFVAIFTTFATIKKQNDKVCQPQYHIYFKLYFKE